MPKYVTETGRAVSPGRVTRASRSIKKTTDSKPLPIHLQCHPKRLTRTKVHPGCATNKTWYGLGFKFGQFYHLDEIRELAVRGHEDTGRYTLYIQGKDGPFDREKLMSTNDLATAMRFKVALQVQQLSTTIIDNRPPTENLTWKRVK